MMFGIANTQHTPQPPAEGKIEQSQTWELLAFKAAFKPKNLAKLCNVSLRTLQRHFAKHYGMTVIQWLSAVRLREAHARLKSGIRVKEVAYDLGFKQLSHFSREFKKIYGVPPSLLNPPGLTTFVPQTPVGPQNPAPLMVWTHRSAAPSSHTSTGI